MTQQLVTLHCGDALTILQDLPDGEAGLVLADPPYNSGGRTTTERTGRSARQKYVSSDAHHALRGFGGDSRDQRGYLAWLSLILAQALRVSAPGAVTLVFCDWRQLPVTSDALQAGGWTWQGIVVWHKPVHRPRRGGFAAACEYVVWGSNGRLGAGDHPVYLTGLHSESQPRKDRVHITQKPVGLLRELVRACRPGGLILDPFMGSGSAGVAAVLEQRRYVGIELDPDHYQTAHRRIADAHARP